MKQNKNRKKLISQFKRKHGNKYNYDAFRYINHHVKGTIICPIHGKFTAAPLVHLRSGCKKCSKLTIKHRFISFKAKKHFIEKAIKVHGHKYLYNKVNYINAHIPIIITCKIHGDFTQKPNNHLNGNGCNYCNNNICKTETELIKHFQTLHNNMYTYEKIKNFTDKKSKMTIICPIHGKFTQVILNHMQGHGCPKCGRLLGKTGWRRNGYLKKPTRLYCIKIGNLYKIGITTKTVEKRYSQETFLSYKILFNIVYINGGVAFDLEKEILRKTKQYAYQGPNIFKYTGISEIRTVNPVNVLKRIINEYNIQPNTSDDKRIIT